MPSYKYPILHNMYKRKEGISLSLEDIAREVDGEICGEPTSGIIGVCPIDNPKENHISFFMGKSQKHFKKLLSGNGLKGVVVSDKLKAAPISDVPLVVVDDVAKAMARIISLYWDPFRPDPGISEKASIHPSVRLGKDVHIGAFVTIGEDSVVGDGSVIMPHTTIYGGVQIGKDVLIHSRVVIRENTIIGNGCVIQSGSVIGGDGFGYYNDSAGIHPVPQVGNVELCEGVEVGCNTCIDRATMGSTRIGSHTKIDNLVQIGHNVTVGSHAIICGQVGIAGSAKIGNGVVLGGGVGVADHVTVADGCRFAAWSGITSDYPRKGDYGGFPAVPVMEWRRQLAALSKLPEVVHTAKKSGNESQK
ncbi:MAG: UDP-3-O-(3-hydroxymyristoyl)glucosamine N-acyltransferase [Candidatus Dadabacteria bacterium]|nr:MAG: UDP-3-O-(3-hydroxymyristoyl)glucosamine N-acyltransferase [Candidatus Dadabacteria bacterium]